MAHVKSLATPMMGERIKRQIIYALICVILIIRSKVVPSKSALRLFWVGEAKCMPRIGLNLTDVLNRILLLKNLERTHLFQVVV